MLAAIVAPLFRSLIQANSPVTFLNARPALAKALVERNYASPTPVQAAVLADEALGGDILVSAQTGSGKTVAYGLAIASTILVMRRVYRSPARQSRSSSRRRASSPCRSIAS